MKKIRCKILVPAMVLILSSLLSGCAGLFHAIEILQSTGEEPAAYNPVETSAVLNERQKALLRELGLPEEYDQLNASQKDGIVMIEKAIVYLEDKYPQKFEYDGYVAGGYDGRYVTVKVVDSCPEEYVNVQIYYENGEYELVDDYEQILQGKKATAEMKEFLCAYFNPSDIQVYMDVYRVNEGDTAPQRAIGVPDMMIKGTYTEKEVKNAARAYARWMLETHHREAGRADFRMYSPEDYEKINEFNYTDYFGDEAVYFDLFFEQGEPLSLEKKEK